MLVRDEIRPLQLRHRLRAVLKNYGVIHLVRVVPQLVVLVVAELVYALVTGRRRTAAALAGAWAWNLRRLGELRRLRRRRSGVPGPCPTARSGACRSGAAPGSTRSSGDSWWVRTGPGFLTAAGRDLAVSLRDLRAPLAVWGGIAAVLLVGSRHVLGNPFPAVGELVPFPDSPATFLRLFVSGWSTAGLGSEGSPPLAFGLLGAAGVLLIGAMGVLQKILVLGAIPAGIIGAHRLARPVASTRAGLVAAVVYAAVPLPYNALARGRWGGLIAYALAPWVLGRLLRATGLAPFGGAQRADADGFGPDAPAASGPAGPLAAPTPDVAPPEAASAAPPVSDPEPTGPTRRLPPLIPHGEPAIVIVAPVSSPPSPPEPSPPAEPPVPPTPPAPVHERPSRPSRPQWRLADHALPLGILLALGCALAPAVASMTVVTAGGVLLGAACTGRLGAGLRAAAAAIGGLLVVAVLLFPWTLEFFLPGANWATFTGVALPEARGLGLGALLRFETGPLGAPPLGWAFVLAAALPLMIARGWRLQWSVRAWTVALVAIGVVWAGGRGWLPVPLPSPEVLLAPAAAALALAAALGLHAFEVDLRGFGFGWRQAALAVAAASVVGVVPVLGAAIDGRWDLPRQDVSELLSFMPEQRAAGAFRVLWLGDPEALPLHGWQLATGIAYGTSRNGPPDATVLWPGSDDGPTQLIPDAVNLARRGDTSRLGHLLAPMAVRYVVVPVGDTGAAASRAAVAALDGQVDLRQLQRDDALVVFENAAWAPHRARLSPAAATASERTGLETARVTELAGSPPVLARERSPFRFTGTLGDDQVVSMAEAYSSAWQLSAGGETAEHRKAFGWANAYEVDAGGRATLRYRTSIFRFVALGVEIVLWVVVVRAALDRRRRREPG